MTSQSRAHLTVMATVEQKAAMYDALFAGLDRLRAAHEARDSRPVADNQLFRENIADYMIAWIGCRPFDPPGRFYGKGIGELLDKP